MESGESDTEVPPPKGFAAFAKGPMAATLPATVALALTALAVTVSSHASVPSCPNPMPRATSLVSQRAGAGVVLVPGVPTSVRLCRYNGLPEPGVALAGFGLVGERAVSSPSVALSLMRKLDALRPASGVRSCPSDEDASILAEFDYRSGSPDLVDIGLHGCEQISNGHLNRLGLDAPVVATVGSMTPVDMKLARADEASLSGVVRVCGGLPGPCRSPTGFNVQVQVTDSTGYWAAGVSPPRDGHYTALASPGRDTVKLVENGASGHPRVLESATVVGRAGRSVAVPPLTITLK